MKDEKVFDEDDCIVKEDPVEADSAAQDVANATKHF